MSKAIIITLVVVGAAVGAFMFFRPTPVDAVRTQYNQWKLDYGVNIGSSEDEYRFNVFTQNLAKIAAHKSTSYTLGVNAFSALTLEEFSATRLGLRYGRNVNRNETAIPKGELKSAQDWSKVMNDVKDQGQCGSCWAFSTVGAIEGAHSVLKSNKLNLAEQELVDCSGSFGNQGCNGGLMDQGFQYVESVGGLAAEESYPYTAADGDCQTVSSRFAPITGHVDVPASDADAFMTAINKQPIAIAIEADTFAFQGYTGGILDDFYGCGTSLDHGVVAVGFDSDAGFFKIRNSWGASWGENGHIRFAIKADGDDGSGMCGMYLMASYPTV